MDTWLKISPYDTKKIVDQADKINFCRVFSYDCVVMCL